MKSVLPKQREEELREAFVKYAEMVLEPEGAREPPAEARQEIAMLEENLLLFKDNNFNS